MEKSKSPYETAAKNAISSETVMMSPQMARTMRAKAHFDRQRPIRQPHVERLKEEMDRGWFLPGTPIWLCVLPSGQEWIINGNHTLEAIGSSDFSVPLTVIRQRVRDEHEAQLAYSSFDVQRTRSYLDAAQAAGLGDNVPFLGRALSAIGYINSDFAPNPWSGSAPLARSRRLRIETVDNYRKALALLASSLRETPRANQSLITKAPVFAVAMATARYQPSAAEEYWGGIARDDGLRIGDPRHSILRYLRSEESYRRLEDMLRAAAKAWNAWFSNEQLERLRGAAAKEPIVLLGTPWAKTKVVQLRRRKAA